MKIAIVLLLLVVISCNNLTPKDVAKKKNEDIEGTWKLLSGTTIQNKDTIITDYTNNKSFIKIINDSHFAFLGHDLNKGKNSLTSFFSSGSGVYKIADSSYTENLEYCNDRQWEGNSFNFTVSVKNDTLIQKGIEKIDSIGIDRINIERYVRVK